VAPLALAEAQNLLDERTTLLSYVVADDKTYAFVITHKSLHLAELAVSEQDLIAAADELHAFASLDETPPSLARLYDWLIAPIRQHLKTPLLGIIPHRILHYVPFAALANGKRYLGNDYTLFYLPNASALPFIQQKRKPANETLLAVAQGQAEGLPILRYASAEAQEIARLYHVEPLLGAAATESAFLARAGEAGLIHIAAHGQFNSAQPLFSRLVLAADSDSDGSLSVADVYGLDLKQAVLVTLSACQTQVGAQSRGDDIVGLARAFIYAGSPTVIASLWSVDDQATGMLMTAFYKHLRQGKSKAASLRAAQAETRARYAHPYYWSAFVLTGDPGMDRERPPERAVLWVAIIFATAVGVGLFVSIIQRRRRRGGGTGDF
jgi:CHAT domain-containing protein